MAPQLQFKNTIIRKIEETHAIWFSESKSFVIFEEPAFTVFQMVSEGKNRNEIVKVCMLKYGHLEENINQFVDEIVQQINYFDNSENYDSISIRFSEELSNCNSNLKYSTTYQLGDTSIFLKYQNEFLRFALDPSLKHLEITSLSVPKHELKLLEKNGTLFYSYNGKFMEAFKEKDFNYFTGSIKQQMFSIIYNWKFNDWMMMLHASGVIRQKQAIVFSAAGGSGKSSISAILKAYGYGYISDDIIAADKNGNVYPFPAAISVKDGAVKTLSEFYPELDEKDSETAVTGKKVRYLPVDNRNEIKSAPYPVKALVFVRYTASGSTIFNEVDKKEALQLLLKETWVNPIPEMVNYFFDWIEKTSFYSLQYSVTNQALEAINKLFD